MHTYAHRRPEKQAQVPQYRALQNEQAVSVCLVLSSMYEMVNTTFYCISYSTVERFSGACPGRMALLSSLSPGA